LAAYITGQLLVGKTIWWGRPGDSGYIPPNGRVVSRGSNPSLYWFGICWHVAIFVAVIWLLVSEFEDTAVEGLG